MPQNRHSPLFFADSQASPFAIAEAVGMNGILTYEDHRTGPARGGMGDVAPFLLMPARAIPGDSHDPAADCFSQQS